MLRKYHGGLYKALAKEDGRGRLRGEGDKIKFIRQEPLNMFQAGYNFVIASVGRSVHGCSDAISSFLFFSKSHPKIHFAN